MWSNFIFSNTGTTWGIHNINSNQSQNPWSQRCGFLFTATCARTNLATCAFFLRYTTHAGNPAQWFSKSIHLFIIVTQHHKTVYSGKGAANRVFRMHAIPVGRRIAEIRPLGQIDDDQSSPYLSCTLAPNGPASLTAFGKFVFFWWTLISSTTDSESSSPFRPAWTKTDQSSCSQFSPGDRDSQFAVHRTYQPKTSCAIIDRSRISCSRWIQAIGRIVARRVNRGTIAVQKPEILIYIFGAIRTPILGSSATTASRNGGWTTRTGVDLFYGDSERVPYCGESAYVFRLISVTCLTG